jgi:hypothetical protein
MRQSGLLVEVVLDLGLESVDIASRNSPFPDKSAGGGLGNCAMAERKQGGAE